MTCGFARVHNVFTTNPNESKHTAARCQTARKTIVPVILGIDLGTHCGFCLLNGAAGGYRVFSGSWTLSGPDDEPEAYHKRASRMRAKLDDWLTLTDVVFYEKVHRHNGVLAAHCYGALEAELKAACAAHGKALKPLGVGAIKKFATGKGNASKLEMLDAAKNLHPGVLTEDEADAFHIASLGKDVELEEAA